MPAEQDALERAVRANREKDFAGALGLCDELLGNAATEAPVRRAAAVERLVALACLNRADAFLGAATDIVDRDGVAPPDLLLEWASRVGGVNETLAKVRLTARLLEAFSARVETPFTPRLLRDIPRFPAARLSRAICEARRGVALLQPGKIILRRSGARAEIGRQKDAIVLLPDAAFAGGPVPYFLGGHTPVSGAGYWVPGFIQGGGPNKELRNELVRWLASTVRWDVLEPADDVVFAVAGGGRNNFGHALFNSLPSLHWYKALGLDCPIVFPRLRLDIAPRLVEAVDLVLEALEIPRERVLTGEVAYRKRFPFALMPNKGDFSSETVAFYGEVVAALVRGGRLRPGGGPPLIYVSRRRATVRPLVNEDDVVARVEALGFVAVEPETLPFIEQVRLFSGARVVAGPHGSGFNLMFFAPEGATLIEIHTVGRDDFLKLTSAARQNYIPLGSRLLPREDRKGFLFEDFDGLERACRQAIELAAGQKAST